MRLPLSQLLKQVASIFTNNEIAQSPTPTVSAIAAKTSHEMDLTAANETVLPSPSEVRSRDQSQHSSTISEPSPRRLSSQHVIPPPSSAGPDVFHEDNSTAHPVQADSEPLPINARCLKIYTFRGNHDEMTSALALTKDLIWQLNAKFRHSTKVERYAKAKERNQAQREHLAEMRTEFQDRYDSAVTDEEREDNFQRLREADVIDEVISESYDTIQQKISAAEAELVDAQNWMYQDMKLLLREYNLLEEVPESEDGDDDGTAMDDVQHNDGEEALHLTPSQIIERDLYTDQENAKQSVWDKIIAMQDAGYIVERWNDYYEEEYKKYHELKESGEVQTSKSEFDVKLLREQQTATGNLIRAEKEVHDAQAYARELGVVFSPEDQESNFLDDYDDGYRESMEADIAAGVDRPTIESWLAQQDTEMKYSTFCDEWDAKSVKICDSVSVVADGKERVRIDRWREICDLQQIESEALVPEPVSEAAVVAPTKPRRKRRCG